MTRTECGTTQTGSSDRTASRRWSGFPSFTATLTSAFWRRLRNSTPTLSNSRCSTLLGAWPSRGGNEPTWPDGQGKRVFAYLKPFPALPDLLAELVALRCPTLVYGNEIGPQLRSRFQSSTLHFASKRLDISKVGNQCDLTILNGTHGATVSMLLAGKPTLQLPIFLEQCTTASGRVTSGASTSADTNNPRQILRITQSAPPFCCLRRSREAIRRTLRTALIRLPVRATGGYIDFPPRYSRSDGGPNVTVGLLVAYPTTAGGFSPLFNELRRLVRLSETPCPKVGSPRFFSEDDVGFAHRRRNPPRKP